MTNITTILKNDRYAQSDLKLLQNLSVTNTTNLFQLAANMGADPQSVFHRLQFLQSCGMAFDLLERDQCRLSNRLDLLDVLAIQSGIPASASHRLASIDLHSTLDSTNQYLLDLPEEDFAGRVCLAEYQTAGRGRHGRQWIAPYATGLCLSLSWRFVSPVERFSLISLLPAVALANVLREQAIPVAFKWPNDVICQEKKLAGILIEVPQHQQLARSVVIGMGINVYTTPAMLELVGQPWIALSELMENCLCRNELATRLITELVNLLCRVESQGLSVITDAWRKHDMTKDKAVQVWRSQDVYSGIARGINDDGALLLESEGVISEFVSGEVSLRLDDNNITG